MANLKQDNTNEEENIEVDLEVEELSFSFGEPRPTT